MKANFWKSLVVAVGLVAIPTVAVAQTLPTSVAQVDAQTRRVTMQGISFVYGPTQVVSIRPVSGANGKATMATITNVDSTTGKVSSDSFITLTVMERAPIIEGAESADHAISIALIQRLSGVFNAPISTEPIGLSLANVEILSSSYVDFGVGNTTAVFAVGRIPQGYLTIYLQHGQDPQVTNEATELLIDSIRVGE